MLLLLLAPARSPIQYGEDHSESEPYQPSQFSPGHASICHEAGSLTTWYSLVDRPNFAC